MIRAALEARTLISCQMRASRQLRRPTEPRNQTWATNWWRGSRRVAVVSEGWGATTRVYPTRPVTMIVPFAPGGPTDVLGRILAGRMRGPLGQTVIVENSTGAGGTIGVGRVARAIADGYTIGLGIWSTHVVNGAIYTLSYDLIKTLSYDLIKDFEPIALVSRTLGLVIVAKRATTAKD